MLILVFLFLWQTKNTVLESGHEWQLSLLVVTIGFISWLLMLDATAKFRSKHIQLACL